MLGNIDSVPAFLDRVYTDYHGISTGYQPLTCDNTPPEVQSHRSGAAVRV